MMKNFLKYSVIGFAVIILAIVFGPMIGGFLFGAAIAVGGYWLYEKYDSLFMKLLAIGIMISGAMCALGSVPFLIFLVAPFVGYYVYEWWAARESGSGSTVATTSPFDNFEKEWNKLTK